MLVCAEHSYNVGQDLKNSFALSEISQRQGFYKLRFLVHIKRQEENGRVVQNRKTRILMKLVLRETEEICCFLLQ